MRILFVTTSTTLGGAEKTVYSLATLLNPARFEVAEVLSLKPFGAYAKRLKELGVRVSTLNLAGRPGLGHVRRVRELIELQKPHLVHAVMYQAIQICRLAKRRCAHPFKLVSSPRVSYRTRSLATLLVDRALKSADDLLISESEASRRYLVERLGYPPAKVRVIRNGVDVASWPVSRLDRARKRLELRLPATDILVGTVGRLDEQKGHATLIEACRQLARKAPVRCAIIGDGPRRKELQKLIRERELEQSVWLLGERDDVVQWLSAFDVFALPSLWEGLPNALLEAMAFGLPVVASNVDGVAEAVEDGKSGLLVPARNPAALAAALLRLASDPPLRARLGEAARKLIAERFTLPRMISEYEGAYEALR